MPIPSMTAFVAGAVAPKSALAINSQLVNAYLRGHIDADDLVDKIRSEHGVRGSNYRVWSESWDSSAYRVSDHGVAPPDCIELDRDAQLDFTSYRVAFAGQLEWADFIGNYTWEKLGAEPVRVSDGKTLKTNPDSWNNWLYNIPKSAIPGIWDDYGEIQARFPRGEYWDRWLTVHNCAKRIYIPGPCVIFVTASALGTFNHNTNPYFNTMPPVDWGDMSVFGVHSECPAVFRLFIDHDGTLGRRFDWSSNNEVFVSNWSPIQPKIKGVREVGYLNGTNRGLEWSFSCAPRACARVASYMEIEEAGWYNISLRYNSRYFYNPTDVFGNRLGFAEMVPAAGALPGWAPALIAYTRWEETGICILAQLKRTVPSDHYQQGDYAP